MSPDTPRQRAANYLEEEIRTVIDEARTSFLESKRFSEELNQRAIAIRASSAFCRLRTGVIAEGLSSAPH